MYFFLKKRYEICVQCSCVAHWAEWFYCGNFGVITSMNVLTSYLNDVCFTIATDNFIFLRIVNIKNLRIMWARMTEWEKKTQHKLFLARLFLLTKRRPDSGENKIENKKKQTERTNESFILYCSRKKFLCISLSDYCLQRVPYRRFMPQSNEPVSIEGRIKMNHVHSMENIVLTTVVSLAHTSTLRNPK